MTMASEYRCGTCKQLTPKADSYFHNDTNWWMCPACTIKKLTADGHLGGDTAEVSINEDGDELEVDGIKFVFTQ